MRLLDQSFNQGHDYRVGLEQRPSNLPGVVGGHRWYMVCPTTDRRATVLYLRSGTGVFAHRLAFPQQRLYYDAQPENKRFRGLSAYFGVDREWEAQRPQALLSWQAYSLA